MGWAKAVGGESECALWAELFRRRDPGLGSVRLPAPALLCLSLASCESQGEFANALGLIFFICKTQVRGPPLMSFGEDSMRKYMLNPYLGSICHSSYVGCYHPHGLHHCSASPGEGVGHKAGHRNDAFEAPAPKVLAISGGDIRPRHLLLQGKMLGGGSMAHMMGLGLGAGPPWARIPILL